MCTVYNNRIEIVNNVILDRIQLSYKMKESDNTSLVSQDVSFFLKDEQARKQGLQDIVLHNSVIVDGSCYQKLHTSSIQTTTALGRQLRPADAVRHRHRRTIRISAILR